LFVFVRSDFVFFGYAATQLAPQVQYELTQVLCSNKVSEVSWRGEFWQQTFEFISRQICKRTLQT